MNKLIDRVLELDEKATDGPWALCYDPKNPQWSTNTIYHVRTGQRVADVAPLRHDNKEVATLIIEYRTLAPQLAKAYQDQQAHIDKLVEALEIIGIEPQNEADLHGSYKRDRMLAREALSQYRGRENG